VIQSTGSLKLFKIGDRYMSAEEAKYVNDLPATLKYILRAQPGFVGYELPEDILQAVKTR
jgi:hypothetical protein